MEYNVVNTKGLSYCSFKSLLSNMNLKTICHSLPQFCVFAIEMMHISYQLTYVSIQVGNQVKNLSKYKYM